MTPTIESRSLSKRYGRRRGIEQVDLRIGEGELFGFLGPNGAGKSTTLRILVGLLRASAGSATVLGRDCWRERATILRDVGYLPGDVRLWPWLSSRTALPLFSKVRGTDLSAEWHRLDERFELDPKVTVRQMSRGMRQKLGLLIAIAHRPRILLLDEPTSGLDPIMQLRLAEVLRERARDGATVLFSSHTLQEVESLCDRVGIVRDGRMIVDETVSTLAERARRRVRVHWKQPPDGGVDAPGVCWLGRDGLVWEGELEGPAPALASRLLAAGAEDFDIESPDLEQLFHSYYRESGS